MDWVFTVDVDVGFIGLVRILLVDFHTTGRLQQTVVFGKISGVPEGSQDDDSVYFLDCYICKHTDNDCRLSIYCKLRYSK